MRLLLAMGLAVVVSGWAVQAEDKLAPMEKKEDKAALYAKIAHGPGPTSSRPQTSLLRS